MSEDDRERLVEQLAGAWRPRDADGQLQSHPAWHDLDATGRADAFEVARRLRELEAALDPQQLSSTARAVLARVRRAAVG